MSDRYTARDVHRAAERLSVSLGLPVEVVTTRAGSSRGALYRITIPGDGRLVSRAFFGARDAWDALQLAADAVSISREADRV